MRGWRFAACALVASVAALGVGASRAAAEATITIEPAPGEDSYSPQRVTRPLDEATFTWVWGPQGAGTDETHDVVQGAGMFESGIAQTEGSFQVTASAGTFPYYCSLHYNMRARVAVTPIAEPGYPQPFRVLWATPESETGKRFEVRYRAGKGDWDTWLEDTSRRSAVFGRNRKPSRVRDGVDYRFEARTLRTKRKRSGWSPQLVVGP